MNQLREFKIGEWKLSFSQLQTYSQCGEKYLWTTLAEERVKRQPASWLVHGNAFHSAVAKWHETGQPAGHLSHLYLQFWDEELEAQLEKSPDLNLWNKTPRVKDVEQDLKLRKAAGLGQCSAYETRYQTEAWEIYGDDEGLFCEIDFDIHLGRHRIRGFLDQVRVTPRGLEVIDVKTGSEKGTDVRQLGLYTTALKIQEGLDVRWGRFYYTKLDSTPKAGDKAGRYSSYYDLSGFNEEYWIKEFDMMVDGITNGVFLPNPSDLCGTCDALAVCRAKPFL